MIDQKSEGEESTGRDFHVSTPCPGPGRIDSTINFRCQLPCYFDRSTPFPLDFVFYLFLFNFNYTSNVHERLIESIIDWSIDQSLSSNDRLVSSPFHYYFWFITTACDHNSKDKRWCCNRYRTLSFDQWLIRFPHIFERCCFAVWSCSFVATVVLFNRDDDNDHDDDDDDQTNRCLPFVQNKSRHFPN